MCWCGKPMSKHAFDEHEGLLIHNGPKSKSRKAPIAKKKRASGTSTQSASQDAWATLMAKYPGMDM